MVDHRIPVPQLSVFMRMGRWVWKLTWPHERWRSVIGATTYDTRSEAWHAGKEAREEHYTC